MQIWGVQIYFFFFFFLFYAAFQALNKQLMSIPPFGK